MLDRRLRGMRSNARQLQCRLLPGPYSRAPRIVSHISLKGKLLLVAAKCSGWPERGAKAPTFPIAGPQSRESDANDAHSITSL